MSLFCDRSPVNFEEAMASLPSFWLSYWALSQLRLLALYLGLFVITRAALWN